MKNKIGSNQHKAKKRLLKTEVWRDIFLISFVVTLACWIIASNHKVISPCPDDGCFVKVVHANVVPLKETVRERIIIITARRFGLQHAVGMDNLIGKESTYNPGAINPTSGACGLFQALPCGKMKCSLDDVDCQLNWGADYIKRRYGNPTNAWKFWQEHNWY